MASSDDSGWCCEATMGDAVWGCEDWSIWRSAMSWWSPKGNLHFERKKKEHVSVNDESYYFPNWPKNPDAVWDTPLALDWTTSIYNVGKCIWVNCLNFDDIFFDHFWERHHWHCTFKLSQYYTVNSSRCQLDYQEHQYTFATPIGDRYEITGMNHMPQWSITLHIYR